MITPTVAVFHPGQMGVAVAAQAVRTGARVLWCPAGRSPSTARRANAAGLTAASLPDLLARSEILLSICPPAAAEDVALTVAELGYRGMYIDANAISPSRALRIATQLNAAGARAIDGAIIGPPPTNDCRARLYLSGDREVADAIHHLFRGTNVDAQYLGGELVTASALKMAYASYQKASRALAAVAHALADQYGVTSELLTEAKNNARSPLSDPDYLPSVAARAWRWAPEMKDIANTLAEAGLPDDLAHAAGHVLDLWKSDKDVQPPLKEVLDHLRRKSPTSAT